jgi:hypothetical protein
LGAREKDCVPYREPGANPPAQVRVCVAGVVISFADDRMGYIRALRNIRNVRLRETVLRMLGELVVRVPMRDRQPGRPKGRHQADDHRNYSRNAPTSHDGSYPAAAALPNIRPFRISQADRSGGAFVRRPDSVG